MTECRLETHKLTYDRPYRAGHRARRVCAFQPDVSNLSLLILFLFYPVFLGVGWFGVRKNGKSGDGFEANPPKEVCVGQVIVLEEYAYFNLTSYSPACTKFGVGWVGVRKNGKSGDGNKAYPPQHKQI